MMRTRANTTPYGLHEDPCDFPVRPVVEAFHAPVSGLLGERTVLSTNRGLRLLQKDSAPLVFLPPSAVALRNLRPSDTLRIDEYGLAVHLHLASGGYIARDAIWYYPGPDPELAVIAGMLCVDPQRLNRLLMGGIDMARGGAPGTWQRADRQLQLHKGAA